MKVLKDFARITFDFIVVFVIAPAGILLTLLFVWTFFQAVVGPFLRELLL